MTDTISMIWPLARKDGSRDLDNPLDPVTGPCAGKDKMLRQLRPVFPGTHPSKYWRDSMLLNFSACMITDTMITIVYDINHYCLVSLMWMKIGSNV
jgi:hypothetical protein